MIDNSLYRKPTEICKVDTALEDISTQAEMDAFIQAGKKAFEDYIAQHGLMVRKATYEDLPIFFKYAKERFSGLLGNTPVYSAYWLDHLISAGHPMLLFDQDGNIKGYKLEASYLNEERTSNGGGIALDDDLAGLKLGMKFFDYISLIAMEKGAKVKRGIIAAYNYPSLHNVLNKSGSIFTEVIPHIEGHGQRFVYKISLTPAGMINNRLDKEGLQTYLKEKTEGDDYQLVACKDAKGILEMYQQSDYRIVAMLRAGELVEEQTFMAVKESALGFPR